MANTGPEGEKASGLVLDDNASEAVSQPASAITATTTADGSSEAARHPSEAVHQSTGAGLDAGVENLHLSDDMIAPDSSASIDAGRLEPEGAVPATAASDPAQPADDMHSLPQSPPPGADSQQESSSAVPSDAAEVSGIVSQQPSSTVQAAQASTHGSADNMQPSDVGSDHKASEAVIAAVNKADEEVQAPAVEAEPDASRPLNTVAPIKTGDDTDADGTVPPKPSQAGSVEASDLPDTGTQDVQQGPVRDSTPPPPQPVEKEEKAEPIPSQVSNTSVVTSTHDHVSKLSSNDDYRPATPQQTASTDEELRASREALADPASVAAVAHAFGRTSPVITSTDSSRPSSRAGLALNQKSLPAFPEEHVAETGNADPTGGSSSAPEVRTKASDPSSEVGVGSGSTDTSALLSPNPTTPTLEIRRSSASSGSGIRIGKGPPPTTQASEELPFDFNRFLEQMKHRSAGPVGEYVRSFIKGFAKKPYRTADQIKLIFDFLTFISERMKESEVWASLNETEFDNAKEAMEKLVMNRLYPYTFTPAVQKEGRWNVQTDDLERDRILKQRIKLFGWLKEEHLDVPVGDHSRGFVEFSIQELLKINHYKAPRDKLICILNCCKVIFGMIRHLSSEENADTFIPVLIFVVLKANPDNLISNVEYISRFRNPERLSSESGYYLSSLMGAIAFIETMDCTSLSNITQEEFEKNVEQAVQTIPEPESPVIRSGPTETPPRSSTATLSAPHHNRTPSATSVTAPNVPGEESAKALPVTPLAASLADDTRAFFQRTGEAARAGLGRPMGALGRLINESIEGIRTPSSGPDSGASTHRQGSPAPAEGASSMTPSTSRNRLFAGLFGPAESESPQLRSPLAGVGPGGPLRRSMALDEEPQTPSTGELTQDGFLPYNAGQAGVAPNAPPRLRPQMPTRGYSIDDHPYDDYDGVGRRNLLTSRGGPRGSETEDTDPAAAEDDDRDGQEDTPNAAAVERMRRRRQMQQDFGFGGQGYVPPFLSEQAARATAARRSPSRRTTAGGGESPMLTRGPLQPEESQTQEALHQSLLDQQVQAQEEAQQSAGVETLQSIFPTVEVGVVRLVLQNCEGDVEMAIDRLLEMQ